MISALIAVCIYSYEAPKAQVVRRFQNLGVQRANPNEYVARYGAQLEDTQSLLTHARQAGVVEDIVSSFSLTILISITSNVIMIQCSAHLVGSRWCSIKFSII